MTSAEGLFARWGHRESYFRWIDWLHRVTYWKRRERQEALRLIQELAPRTVLDFGCNNGFLSASIQTGTGAEVYATDINKSALQRAARYYPNVSFIEPDVAASMQAKFDVIVLCHVLEHVDDCDTILGDLEPLLSPGGRLIVLVPQERLRGDVTWHHLVYYSIKHRRIVNPHVRIVRRKNLQKMLSRQGLVMAKHVYINFFPPFTSQILFWPYAFSLVASCGRLSETPGELHS